MYTTVIYSPVAPNIKTAYILETEINGKVIETKHSTKVPRTNRGLEKPEGWLGSWTDTAGTTFDHYSRGLCVLVEKTELINSISEYQDVEPERWGWELKWQPAND